MIMGSDDMEKIVKHNLSEDTIHTRIGVPNFVVISILEDGLSCQKLAT